MNTTKINNFISKYYIPLISLGFISLIFTCFVNISAFPIADWDEARHGVSAYEMLKNNNYIINTYNYANDYWNLKPPISFLAIILSFKLFGISVFSFRFSSALAMLATGMIITTFLYKKYGKFESLIALILFSVCTPLYQAHIGRHGDADSLFILFFTISMISMLLIRDNSKMLYLCGFNFALAFLTKSWHALVIVAIGGLFLLLSGFIKKFKFKEWLLFIASFTIPIGIWIFTRLAIDGSKFLITMFKYDLLKRSNEAIEGHGESIFYYFKYLLLNGTYIMIPISIIIALSFFKFNKNLKEFSYEVLGYSLWILVPLILFTIAKTKLAWYIIPIYIPLIIVTSILFVRLLNNINKIIVPLTISLVLITGIFTQGFITYKLISNPPIDELQTFIVHSMNDENLHSKDIYILNNGVSEWPQSKLFISEISGDLKCNFEGLEGFISHPDSLLLIDKSSYSLNMDSLNDMTIVSEDKNYILLKNE